ncbi:MAG: VWA domain-containing protein [Gammaproteobacteria bacterium]|nr:VWA domain-containing protein [Gammaproteobacteria bacterium]
MKAKLLAAALIVVTVGVVAFYPMLDSRATGPLPQPQPAPAAQKIEAVFVLDTTSSMTGLIETAKEKIWSIATTLAQAEQTPAIEIGLVAYRDRGDAYVTQVIDLSTDLDTMYGQLMQFAAVGGGDTPESVNRALADAVHRISWSQDPQSYRVIFLVGDAPPHDYPGETHYRDIVASAVAKGIVVNTIQCGDMPQTIAPWTEIARLGHGRYLRVSQAGDAFAVATPYDDEIAQLSAELDRTRLFYGNDDEMRRLNAKIAATERLEAEASIPSRARRAAFNATEAGHKNLFGDNDLVEDIAAGEVSLDNVPAEELPASLRALAREEQERLIGELASRRETLKQQIESLTGARSAFIDERVDAADGAAGSLDRQLYDVVREQAAPVGLTFDAGPEF